MATFTSVIQSFPPTLWEQYALEKHTLMLLQVSKGMIEAVCYVGRAPLPAQIDVKPSEVQETLRWNRDKCVELRLDRVRLLVNFVQETDTAAYLMTAHNVINALQYMPNVKTLDFSGLRVICDTEREAVSTNHEVDVYWSNEYASSEAYVKFGKDAYFQVEVIPWFLVRQFLDELTLHCTGVEKMYLTAAMVGVVMRVYDDPVPAYAWLGTLTNLRTLSLVGMEINSEIACDILTEAMKSTSLTELNMDDNPIDNMLSMLVKDTSNFRLPILRLSGCGFGGWDDDDDLQDASADAVFDLLTMYTTLAELDLGANMYGDIQGLSIAEALRSITNLTKLDLRDNYVTADVKQDIRAAWQPRLPQNLLLDEDVQEEEEDDDDLDMDMD